MREKTEQFRTAPSPRGRPERARAAPFGGMAAAEPRSAALERGSPASLSRQALREGIKEGESEREIGRGRAAAPNPPRIGRAAPWR